MSFRKGLLTDTHMSFAVHPTQLSSSLTDERTLLVSFILLVLTYALSQNRAAGFHGRRKKEGVHLAEGGPRAYLKAPPDPAPALGRPCAGAAPAPELCTRRRCAPADLCPRHARLGPRARSRKAERRRRWWPRSRRPWQRRRWPARCH